MGVSRKNYEAIAAELLREREAINDRWLLTEDRHLANMVASEGIGLRHATEAIANVLAADNPRFDRSRFMAAAGW